MKKSFLSRRDFLKSAAMVSIPFTLSGLPLYGLTRQNVPLVNENNDKILVLVQLQGGNDGLATIFHAAQYANLNAVRNNIIIPENSILNFHNGYGFHSAMQGMKDLWQMEALGIVQNVGYPNQNRSHFRSTDIWNTGSSAEVFENKGWIGRYYDLDYSDYPNGYPNTANPHPFALTMGKIVSETCQGVNANYSLSLLDPLNPGTALVGAGGDIPSNCYGDALSFVNETVLQTNAFASVISTAAKAGNNLSPKWSNLTTDLANKLKNVARLISGGLRTKIYIVQLGGFDTHDNQVVGGTTNTGIHSNLLKELSDAVCAFQDDLRLLNVADKVMGMTYSEFGRRIRSNAALGTDHGTAAPVFLFGSCIQQQILGEHPEIDTQVGTEDGVPMQFDFRDIYGTVLHSWLGLEKSEVKNILYPDMQTLSLFKSGCTATTSAIDFDHEGDFQINVFPNPASHLLRIQCSKIDKPMKLSVFDGKGALIHSMVMESNANYNQSIELNVANYPPGSYFVHVECNGMRKTKKFIKI
ncbi:MAG: DUF1501 domain-containing protein [Candidatus Kapabacteria bacterium]|nr:DUF1501 domain-containing protein [Candidatus Kapabacteria bacterium]